MRSEALFDVGLLVSVGTAGLVVGFLLGLLL
jgi:tetrahydromethanopterin S-methyltransferase subunit F